MKHQYSGTDDCGHNGHGVDLRHDVGLSSSVGLNISSQTWRSVLMGVNEVAWVAVAVSVLVCVMSSVAVIVCSMLMVSFMICVETYTRVVGTSCK
jgi:hypothetical protein